MTCAFPLCKYSFDDGSDYCLHHRKWFGVPKPKKSKQPIAAESKKRIKEKRVYSKIVKAKIEESGGLCVLKGPTCSIYAEGGDHTQNRSPKNYADPNNIEPSCNNCNTLKVRFPQLFPGHVISRFKKAV